MKIPLTKLVEVWNNTFLEVSIDRDEDQVKKEWLEKRRRYKYMLPDDLLQREKGFVRDAKLYNIRNRK